MEKRRTLREPKQILEALDDGRIVNMSRRYFNDFANYLEEQDRPMWLGMEICGERITLKP